MITQGVDAVLTIVHAIRSRWRCRHRQHVKEGSKIHLGLFKRFTLQELQVATDNFRETNIVGVDVYGKVYRGKLADDSLVAVKRLYGDGLYGQREFQAVGDLINYICFHRNILCVIGFCMTLKEQFLVYPFMANGSLKAHLTGHSPSKPPLNWPTRMRIALGTARGLSFLHELCDPKIIHGDVTTSNIFLDEEFVAVLGNFGLAIQMAYKDDHVTTDIVRGTSGWIAPEYVLSGKFSEKCDVFGYGITLLELITGQNGITASNEDVLVLQDWLQEQYLRLSGSRASQGCVSFQVKGLLKEEMLKKIVDPNLQNNYAEEEVESLIQIALLCTQGTPEHRPKMSEVVRMLQGNANSPTKRWVEQELNLEMALYRTFHTTSD